MDGVFETNVDDPCRKVVKGQFPGFDLQLHIYIYIESWHETLKYSYLERARKLRPDDLAFILLQEFPPDFRRKVVRFLLGFDWRCESKIEIEQRQQCDALTDEDAENYVFQEDFDLGRNEMTKKITIRSFQHPNFKYDLALNIGSNIFSCSCNFHSRTSTVCQYIILAHRALGFVICYSTRGNGKSVESPAIQLLAQEEEACLQRSRPKWMMLEQTINLALWRNPMKN